MYPSRLGEPTVWCIVVTPVWGASTAVLGVKSLALIVETSRSMELCRCRSCCWPVYMRSVVTIAESFDIQCIPGHHFYILNNAHTSSPRAFFNANSNANIL